MGTIEMHKVMELSRFIEGIKMRAYGIPYDYEHVRMIEIIIGEKALELFPEYKTCIEIEGKEIRFKRPLKQYDATLLPIFPCMFDLKNGFFYDLYEEYLCLCQISFKRIIDTDGGLGFVTEKRNIDPQKPICVIVEEQKGGILEKFEIARNWIRYEIAKLIEGRS